MALNYLFKISLASSTDFTTAAMPPWVFTTLIKVRCSGVADRPGFFTSRAVNIATFLPTMSGVISRVDQPIRSELPGHSPKTMTAPNSVRHWPTLLRNKRTPWLPNAMRISFRMSVSVGCEAPGVLSFIDNAFALLSGKFN